MRTTWIELFQDIPEILSLISEEDRFEFAQASKASLKLAHEITSERGFDSRLQWLKLVAMGTRDPSSLHSDSELLLEGENKHFRNIFSESARRLFLLTGTGRQVVVEDKLLDRLVQILSDEGVEYSSRIAAAGMLGVFAPCLSDDQVDRVVCCVVKKLKEEKHNNVSTHGFLLDLISLLAFRLQKNQLVALATHPNLANLAYMDMIDIMVNAERVDEIFNNHILPALKSQSVYFYNGFVSAAMFIRLSRHLSVDQKEMAGAAILSQLPDLAVGFGSHRLKKAYAFLQVVAPTALRMRLKDSFATFFSQSERFSTEALKSWKTSCNDFGGLAPFMTPEELDNVISMLIKRLTDYSAAPVLDGVDDWSVYYPAFQLLKDLSSYVSDTARALCLDFLQQYLSNKNKRIRCEALDAFSSLLRRANIEQCEKFKPIVIRLLLTGLANKKVPGEPLGLLLDDVGEKQISRIIPRLATVLPDLEDYSDGIQEKHFYEWFLIHYISKERLIQKIDEWKNTSLQLFLSSIASRLKDLSNDELMKYMPTVISFMCDAAQQYILKGYATKAQNIIIEFTSRKDVLLPRGTLLSLFGALLDPNMSVAMSAALVWNHLMSLGHYNLRPLNAQLRREGGLTELIYLLDEIADVLKPATQLTADDKKSLLSPPQARAFFRIVPRNTDVEKKELEKLQQEERKDEIKDESESEESVELTLSVTAKAVSPDYPATSSASGAAVEPAYHQSTTPTIESVIGPVTDEHKSLVSAPTSPLLRHQQPLPQPGLLQRQGKFASTKDTQNTVKSSVEKKDQTSRERKEVPRPRSGSCNIL